MILEYKKDLLNKYYTNKIGLKHLWLFFSFFLVLGLLTLNIVVIYGLTLVPFQSRSDLDKYKILFPYFPIMLVVLLTLLTLSIFWWINSLAHILFIRYYHYNIFRAEKWLKIKLFTALNFSSYLKLAKNINALSIKDKMFLLDMQKYGLFVQGSFALSLAYKDYYRKPNDIDFSSMNDNTTPKEIKNFSNLQISFIDDVVASAKYGEMNIEILTPKFIPKSYHNSKSGIILPNNKYLLAMKLQQLFRLYKMKQENTKINDAKIYDNLSDIAFIISKTKYLCFRTIIKDFKNISLGNYFVSYFLNTITFESFDKVHDLKKMLHKYIQKIEILNELEWFFDKLFLAIKDDKELNKLHQSINKIIINKNLIDNSYLNFSSSNYKSLEGYQRYFANMQEKQTYLAQFPNQFNSQLIANYYANFSNQQINALDIRQILLLELDKQLGVLDEK